MADDPHEGETDEERDERERDEAFTSFLDKLGPTWLETKLTEIAKAKPDLFKATPTEPAPTGDLTTYLSRELDEARKEGRNLRATLEDILDVLTPEQRSTLRQSRQKKSEDDPPSQTPKNKSEPPPAPKPPPKAKPLSNLLKRL